MIPLSFISSGSEQELFMVMMKLDSILNSHTSIPISLYFTTRSSSHCEELFGCHPSRRKPEIYCSAPGVLNSFDTISGSKFTDLDPDYVVLDPWMHLRFNHSDEFYARMFDSNSVVVNAEGLSDSYLECLFRDLNDIGKNVIVVRLGDRDIPGDYQASFGTFTQDLCLVSHTDMYIGFQSVLSQVCCSSGGLALLHGDINDGLLCDPWDICEIRSNCVIEKIEERTRSNAKYSQ